MPWKSSPIWFNCALTHCHADDALHLVLLLFSPLTASAASKSHFESGFLPVCTWPLARLCLFYGCGCLNQTQVSFLSVLFFQPDRPQVLLKFPLNLRPSARCKSSRTFCHSLACPDCTGKSRLGYDLSSWKKLAYFLPFLLYQENLVMVLSCKSEILFNVLLHSNYRRTLAPDVIFTQTKIAHKLGRNFSCKGERGLLSRDILGLVTKNITLGTKYKNHKCFEGLQ